MGATGESVRRLTNMGFNPSWSPDGREIAFGTESVRDIPRGRGLKSALRIVTIETGEVRELPVDDGVQPDWSPHGPRIAYWAASDAGQRDLWTISIEGDDPIAVTEDEAVDWNPVWSSDGRYLYFSSDRGGTMNIWRVRIDENTGKTLGPPEPVTTGASEEPMHLSISADGKRMAYASNVSGRSIMKVSLDPETFRLGEPTPVTRGSLSFAGPDVSPDGTWLAFFQLAVQEDIFISRPDGTESRQLTNDAFNDRFPRWSPDGTQIAFYSNRSGTYQVWAIRPDGSGLSQLTDASHPLLFPVWSPDGKRLAATDLVRGGFIISVEGSRAVSLTPLPPLADDEFFVTLDWSHDGNAILGEAVSSKDRRGPIGVVLYFPQTSRYERLTDFGGGARWLGDGKTVVFANEGSIYTIDETRTTRTLLTVPGRVTFPTGSPDDQTVFYTWSRTEADLWMIQMEN